MYNLVSRLGRGAVKNARVHLTGLRPANSHNGINWNVSASLHVNSSTDANDVPSLRTKLENDINALEWGTFSTSSPNETHRPSLRLAARIANSVRCTLDPETPRYLASAMEDSNSSQCRLIVTAEPPFMVVHWAPSMLNKSIKNLISMFLCLNNHDDTYIYIN